MKVCNTCRMVLDDSKFIRPNGKICKNCNDCAEKHMAYKVKIRKLPVKVDSRMYKNLKEWLTVDDGLQPDSEGYATVLCYKCGKRFRPHNNALDERMQALKGNHKGENHLYCSDECKNTCNIYKQIAYPKGYKHFYQSVFKDARVQYWAKMVLKRDNHTCQRCGSTEHPEAHHIIPLSQAPMRAADLDNGITLCEHCHVWVHNEIPGCSYHELALEAKLCKQIYEEANAREENAKMSILVEAA